MLASRGWGLRGTCTGYNCGFFCTWRGVTLYATAMSADQPLAGRHQRLLEWDEVDLPKEQSPKEQAESPASLGAQAKVKAEPTKPMSKLKSLLNRKLS